MADIDYTKVEQAIEKSFQDLLIRRLQHLAEIIEKFGFDDLDNTFLPPQQEEYDSLLQHLHHTLSKILQTDDQVLEKIGIPVERLRDLPPQANALKEEDWKLIQSARVESLKYLTMLRNKNEPQKNEELVKEQKKLHKTKRFNIREEWWPI